MKKNRRRLLWIATILCLSSPLLVNASDNEIEEDIQITEEVKNVDKAGTYFVKVSMKNEQGQVMKKTMRVHVKYPKTILNYEIMEGIDSSDIVVLTGALNKLNKQELIKEGGAHAWSMENGKAINNVNAEVKEPLKDTGTAGRVKYSTDKDTTVYSNVFEQDKIYLNLDQIYMTQRPVLTDKIRTLSILIISLTIVPLIIFLTLFKYVSKKVDDVKNIISK